MSQTNFSTFKELLSKSIYFANHKFAFCLRTLFFLLLFLIKDLVFATIVFYIGASFRSSFGIFFEVVSILYLFYMFLKYNGAISLALGIISTEQTGAYQIAKKADHEGFYFFINALSNGVILFLGQVVMVCPCFLVMSNFIFSPFLYIYENLKGSAARKRSRELTNGFGWIILNRSVAFLFIGYIFLALIVLSLLTKFVVACLILIFVVGLYLAIIQNIFIRELYLETKSFEFINESEKTPTNLKFKMLTVFVIVVIVLFYIAIRIIPQTLRIR